MVLHVHRPCVLRLASSSFLLRILPLLPFLLLFIHRLRSVSFLAVVAIIYILAFRSLLAFLSLGRHRTLYNHPVPKLNLVEELDPRPDQPQHRWRVREVRRELHLEHDLRLRDAVGRLGERFARIYAKRVFGEVLTERSVVAEVAESDVPVVEVLTRRPSGERDIFRVVGDLLDGLQLLLDSLGRLLGAFSGDVRSCLRFTA